MWRLTLFPAVLFLRVGAACAEPVQFGEGVAPGATISVDVRTVESRRVGTGVPITNATSLKFAVTMETDALGGRRLHARLTQTGVESDDRPTQAFGETEVYMLDALRSVPVILEVGAMGQVSGVVDWPATRLAAQNAVESRAEALNSERPALHADQTLPASVLDQIDTKLPVEVVALFARMPADEFVDRLYHAPALILLMSGQRIDIGQSAERRTMLHDAADGRPLGATDVWTLSATEAGSKAVFDLKLGVGADQVIRDRLMASLRTRNLGPEEIERKMQAMPIKSEAVGIATIDIATGLVLHSRWQWDLRIGAVEATTSEEVMTSAGVK